MDRFIVAKFYLSQIGLVSKWAVWVAADLTTVSLANVALIGNPT